MPTRNKPPKTISEIIDHVEQLQEELHKVQTALEKLEPAERPEKAPGRIKLTPQKAEPILVSAWVELQPPQPLIE
jgi:hypothetical protein